MEAIKAVKAWRGFANSTQVTWRGRTRSWAAHIEGNGYADEEALVQPVVFPAFADGLLDFQVGYNLAPERADREGKPDFTPADAVTHPFVFETKGSKDGTALLGYESQVRRYLKEGRPRIKKVVLTNLIGLRVCELDASEEVFDSLNIDLRGLLSGSLEGAATTGDARRLASFLVDFRRAQLTTQEKIDRVRAAPEWNPITEVTSPDWISARLDSTVSALHTDVLSQIAAGALLSPAHVSDEERDQIVEELRLLAFRLGEDWEDAQSRDIASFISASRDSPADKALQQYSGHVAYYATTRLALVRIWEDLGLLESILHDGGFDQWMTSFRDVVSDVVGHSFTRAKSRYRSLFDRTNSYTWFEPSEDTYANAIYELANTYFGGIESDVLGEVYERLLERIDRKLLGQYYTPRDIIRLIWDLIDGESVAEEAELESRSPRVLDIATGSGGFLVEYARRLRVRLQNQLSLGAAVDRQSWLNGAAEGFTGIEIQRFPAYLGELNLLIQFGRLIVDEASLRIPSLGIVSRDTLSLHNPDSLTDPDIETIDDDLLMPDPTRRQREVKIREALQNDYLMDVACGNPPYLGEKSGAAVFARTRQLHPYWERFVGPHMDYLYWFLILGISKLREQGRFGFITTEYWLRAAGARPLRRYMAERCQIERLILFRDVRLFPDAPGQHSMIVVGRRAVPPDGLFDPEIHTVSPAKPQVSIYEGPPLAVDDRGGVLDVLRTGRSALGVRSFAGAVSPNELAGDSWSSVVLSVNQYRKRRQLMTDASPLVVNAEEGVLSSANRMQARYADQLPQETLREIGWPDKKAGIFVLTPSEAESLGHLNELEKETLRPFVNTADVFPYATVLPEQPDRLVYLPPPDTRPSDLSAVQTLPFPSGMPNLKSHLMRFKPLLESKVQQYSDRRPWWAIHRPRRSTIAREEGFGRWADYCLVPNWGSGGGLVVGLGLKGSAPAQGLHALYGEVVAPYLCGLLNSTVVQDLAETLPPGYLRTEWLEEELKLPLIPDQVDGVTDLTVRLADLVHDTLGSLSSRFPLLAASLQEDVSLSSVDDDAWIPSIGSPTQWGPLTDVSWIDAFSSYGSQRSPIRKLGLDHDLLGLVVWVEGDRGARAVIRFDRSLEDSAPALLAYLRGIGAQGGTLSDLPSLFVPVMPESLQLSISEDRRQLRDKVEQYRKLRSEIDDALGLVI